MTYDLNEEYRRCGHKMQQAFGITAEEFQAARKVGRKKKFRDILEWIKENRRDPQPDAPIVRHQPTSGHGSMNIPGLMPRGTIVLVPVPTEKLSDVLAVLGH